MGVVSYSSISPLFAQLIPAMSGKQRSGEGRQTRGTMREADLKLMESGFFKESTLLEKPAVFIQQRGCLAFLHVCLILIFSCRSEGPAHTKQVNLGGG